MRKFVIKNRQKRKYTRKSEEFSSFSFSKTAYNMIPLIVMLIAFMSTIIISAPIRDAFTNISFTFELPKFSLANPLSFFQTSATDISQIGMVILSVVQSFAGAISQGFIITGRNFLSGTLLLTNSLILCGTMISNCGIFVLQEASKGIGLLDQFISFTFVSLSMVLRNCISALVYFTIVIGQFISSITLYTIQQCLFLGGVILHFIVISAVAIGSFLIFIVITAINIIISAVTFIGMLISHIFLAIVHVIEIPFKILYAFWLLIKPYVDIFDKHIQISGSDFSDMFNSISKIASLTSRAK